MLRGAAGQRHGRRDLAPEAVRSSSPEGLSDSQIAAHRFLSRRTVHIVHRRGSRTMPMPTGGVWPPRAHQAAYDAYREWDALVRRRPRPAVRPLPPARRRRIPAGAAIAARWRRRRPLLPLDVGQPAPRRAARHPAPRPRTGRPGRDVRGPALQRVARAHRRSPGRPGRDRAHGAEPLQDAPARRRDRAPPWATSTSAPSSTRTCRPTA